MNLKRRTIRGMTLVEVLTVITLLTLVLSMMTSIYAAALKLYHQTRGKNANLTQGTMALRRLAPDLRGARRIDGAWADQLILTRPRQDPSGQNIVPLEDGAQVWFYRGDGQGNLQSNGSFLWRAIKPVGQPTFTIDRKLAEGINSVTFEYEPGSSDPEAVRVTVITTTTIRGRAVTRTETARFALRNHGL